MTDRKYAVRRTDWWTEDDETVATWTTESGALAFAAESRRCWPSEHYEVVDAPEQERMVDAPAPESNLRSQLSAAERARDEARAIIPAAKALLELLDDDGMCRVCGETLDECHEECEARVLRAALAAKPDK